MSSAATGAPSSPRCSLLSLSRAQLKADADAAASNNDSADRVAEAVEGCAAAIAHAQEGLRGCVGTAVSPVHRTVLQVQSVVAVCCIRSGQRSAALAPLDSAVRAMVAHLPPSWPELLEWQLRLLELHASLEEYGDVIVRVEGANGASEEFPCVASLLAASSRPLGAMLFGGMRACTPQSGPPSSQK